MATPTAPVRAPRSPSAEPARAALKAMIGGFSVLPSLAALYVHAEMSA